MLHLNGFFPSWVVAMCPDKLFLCWKVFPHIWHITCFFSSWTDEIWYLRPRFCLKWESQISHLKDFFLSSSMMSVCFLFWWTIRSIYGMNWECFQIKVNGSIICCYYHRLINIQPCIKKIDHRTYHLSCSRDQTIIFLPIFM